MLVSSNKRFQFRHQRDGNVVVYDTIPKLRATWASDTSHEDRCELALEADGKLVLYEQMGHTSLWDSNTAGDGDASSVLVMQDDGDAVILSNGECIWSTSSKQGPPKDEKRPFKAGESLGEDEALVSPDGRYRLVMQADRELVLFDLAEDSCVTWASDTPRSYGFGKPHLNLGNDGNLTIRVDDDDDDRPIWSSNTAGKGDESSVLTVQDDGDITISSKGTQIWSSGSKRKSTDMDRIIAGETLRQAQSLKSPNGRYQLIMQPDGNLVLYDISNDRRPIWASNSKGGKPKVQLGLDGDLTVYDGTWKRWSTRTSGQGDKTSILRVQDDGNMVLFSNNVPIWQTDTKQKPVSNKLTAGERLKGEESLVSDNKKFTLIYQTDGNLVIYDLREGRRPIWASGTGRRSGKWTILQTDGNLAISRGDDSQWGPIWTSKTKGNNAVAIMQDDGNLIITSDGKEIWSTNSAPH